MESKARVLDRQESGSLILSHSRTPYIVGCVLPHVALHPGICQTAVEASIVFHQGKAMLLLHVQIEAGGFTHHLQVLIDHAAHCDFLHAMQEASAFYLLTGWEHPALYSDEEGTGKTLYQRVNEGGVAIELNEQVRTQIGLLEQLAKAMPPAQLNVL